MQNYLNIECFADSYLDLNDLNMLLDFYVCKENTQIHENTYYTVETAAQLRKVLVHELFFWQQCCMLEYEEHVFLLQLLCVCSYYLLFFSFFFSPVCGTAATLADSWGFMEWVCFEVKSWQGKQVVPVRLRKGKRSQNI